MSILDSVQNVIARTVMKLPDRRLVKMSGGKPRSIAGRVMDPQLQFATFMTAKGPQFEDVPVKKARKMMDNICRSLDQPLQKVGQVKDFHIPVAAGEIALRVIQPAGNVQQEMPALLFFHGGGMVIGSIDGYENFCRIVANSCRCVVIAVDYRLAPEHKFPTGLEDSFTAYEWVLDNAAELGLDMQRVSVGGDSAGGYISAIICHLARERERPQPRSQFLLYPMTDLRANTESYELFGQGNGLTRSTMEWFIGNYINGDADRVNPLASPLLREDFSGLAPALVVTAGFDPLIDEGFAYKEKLAEAGTEVQYMQMDSMIHGFIYMTGYIRGARRALDEVLSALSGKL